MAGEHTVESVTDCVKCGEHAVRQNLREDVRHCFSCGYNQSRRPQAELSKALSDIAFQLHSDLLSAPATLDELRARFGLHPQVLVDSAVGRISNEFDPSLRLVPVIQAAEEEIERLTSSRGRGRPTKEEIAARALAEERLANAKKAQTLLTDFAGRNAERFVFIYTNAAGDVRRLGAMSLETGDVDYVLLGATGGVFNHQLFAAGVQPRMLQPLRGRQLILASEIELLQLQSLAARIAALEGTRPEQGYLPAFAVGSADIDADTVRQLGRMPLFIKTGSNTVRDQAALQAIREELNLFSCSVSEPLGVHVRDSGDTGAVEHLANAVNSRVLVTRPFRAVRDEIDLVRAQEPIVNKFLVDRRASRVLVRDLTERGQLFYDGRQAYVHDTETSELFTMDRDDSDSQLFLNRYGIAPGDAFAKQAINAIRLQSQQAGVTTQIHNLSHYDREQNRLYLFTHGKSVLRIGPSHVEEVTNGTDGVLFLRDRKSEPFTLTRGVRGDLRQSLFGGMRFREQQLTALEQQELLETWFYALFFPELFPTRPILAMIGEKGSGKTAVLRRIGQLLFGSGFQVMGMSHEPKDFDAAITGEAFVAIDNADTNIPWLEDKLAVVATGGTLKRRLLYTTNQLVEFPVTAFVAVTSRTPHFRREDIADRLLPFHIERLESFQAESVLLTELRSKRNEIMTQVVDRLQEIVRALDERNGQVYPTKFRMADFAQFAFTIADTQGRLDEVQKMLDRAAKEQLAFSTQDDPVLEVIERWLESAKNLNREVTTAELFAELRDLSVNSMPQLPFDFKSARAFGVYLAGAKGTLRELFGATDRTVGGRRHLWRFSRKGLAEPGGGGVKGESEIQPLTSLEGENKKAA